MLTFVEPLGPISVAGGLEARRPRVPDHRPAHRRRGEGARRAAGASRREVVGLQCNFTTERCRTLRLARRVRRELPDGLHRDRRPRRLARSRAGSTDSAFDAIAIGDGEEVMPPLVAALERGERSRRACPACALRRGGDWSSTGHAPTRRDLDTFRCRRAISIAHYAPHYYINFRKPLALMETARGCPFKCNFCSVWKFHESTFREKSPGAGGGGAARRSRRPTSSSPTTSSGWT